MAAGKRPSYLKRQKERKRQEKAEHKRQARIERRSGSGGGDIHDVENMDVLTGPSPELLGDLAGPGAEPVADDATEESETDRG